VVLERTHIYLHFSNRLIHLPRSVVRRIRI